jgi:hypothetical protein
MRGQLLAYAVIVALGTLAALWLIDMRHRQALPPPPQRVLMAGTWDPPGNALQQIEPEYWMIGYNLARAPHWSDAPIDTAIIVTLP